MGGVHTWPRQPDPWTASVVAEAHSTLTIVLSLAPASGGTHCPNREVIVSSGQTHGRHSLRELGRSGQLQQGDVIAHSEYVELGVLENL